MKVSKDKLSDSIEQKIPKEIEKKFTPKDPEAFSDYKEQSYPIEQIYLSHPFEPWSLRLREIATGQGQIYSAALKSRSKSQDVLVRDEIETAITEAAYRFYASNPEFPRLHKLRAEPHPDVTIDWVEGYDLPIIEAESSQARAVLQEYGYTLEDVTRNRSSQNEMMAHLLFQAQHGEGTLIPQANLDSLVMLSEVMKRLDSEVSPIVVSLSGRSGSGKSTLTKELAKLLGSKEVSNTTLSTDDYNRGKTWLCQHFGVETWHNWDNPIVYDCPSLAQDIWLFKEHGQLVKKRRFDFSTEEPVLLDETHPPAKVIILEGLFAHSSHFSEITTLSYRLPTPLATSVGRRIYRDINSRGNDSFGSAAEVLRYQLEVVEPSYQKAIAA